MNKSSIALESTSYKCSRRLQALYMKRVLCYLNNHENEVHVHPSLESELFSGLAIVRNLLIMKPHLLLQPCYVKWGNNRQLEVSSLSVSVTSDVTSSSKDHMSLLHALHVVYDGSQPIDAFLRHHDILSLLMHHSNGLCFTSIACGRLPLWLLHRCTFTLSQYFAAVIEASLFLHLKASAPPNAVVENITRNLSLVRRHYSQQSLRCELSSAFSTFYKDTSQLTTLHQIMRQRFKGNFYRILRPHHIVLADIEPLSDTYQSLTSFYNIWCYILSRTPSCLLDATVSIPILESYSYVHEFIVLLRRRYLSLAADLCASELLTTLPKVSSPPQRKPKKKKTRRRRKIDDSKSHVSNISIASTASMDSDDDALMISIEPSKITSEQMRVTSAYVIVHLVLRDLLEEIIDACVLPDSPSECSSNIARNDEVTDCILDLPSVCNDDILSAVNDTLQTELANPEEVCFEKQNMYGPVLDGVAEMGRLSPQEDDWSEGFFSFFGQITEDDTTSSRYKWTDTPATSVLFPPTDALLMPSVLFADSPPSHTEHPPTSPLYSSRDALVLSYKCLLSYAENAVLRNIIAVQRALLQNTVTDNNLYHSNLEVMSDTGELKKKDTILNRGRKMEFPKQPMTLRASSLAPAGRGDEYVSEVHSDSKVRSRGDALSFDVANTYMHTKHKLEKIVEHPKSIKLPSKSSYPYMKPSYTYVKDTSHQHFYYSVPEPMHDVSKQSPLTREVLLFVSRIDLYNMSMQRAKNWAIDKLRAAVQSLWPRAQVKPFGSFISGLSLPSSDLDLVICLPKVHMEAGPEAPGALEGRNAIKESWQQNLARCLRREDWVDVSSIKVIPNTLVPVIKLRTVSSEGFPYEVSLDVSFEGFSHRGLDANKLNISLIREFPALRPLVLVLKQFLSRHGLCEAFTGGLSSYALLLLAARFLQDAHVLDIGAALIGFLGFFGNHYDPASMGVSVGKRCYFSRAIVPVESRSPPSAIPHERSNRRHSYNIEDMNFIDYNPHATYKPFKFDPLFVEDPLVPGNNVGRNCFRVHQVQRSWSEAHTVLAAKLTRIQSEGVYVSLLDYLVGDLNNI